MQTVLSGGPSPGRSDLYARVTSQVIAAIEAGAGAFEMPWHSKGVALQRPRNVVRNTPYQGINVLALWSQAMTRGFESAFWGTYRQWQELGFQVRKGEKATTVVYYRQVPRQASETPEGDEGTPEYRFIARAFYVFNASQVEGWQQPTEKPGMNLVEYSDTIECLVEALGVDIRYGGDKAYYRPFDDYIQLPHRRQFKGSSTSSPTETFYATLLHELVHWTGHPKRLCRDLSGRVGSEAYAMEELVAELGSAFLCAGFLLPNEPRPDHAAYVAHWLKVLKDDKRAIFFAARLASEAASSLLPV